MERTGVEPVTSALQTHEADGPNANSTLPARFRDGKACKLCGGLRAFVRHCAVYTARHGSRKLAKVKLGRGVHRAHSIQFRASLRGVCTAQLDGNTALFQVLAVADLLRRKTNSVSGDLRLNLLSRPSTTTITSLRTLASGCWS
jgi:hypothetical protein